MEKFNTLLVGIILVMSGLIANFVKGTNAWWLAHLSNNADIDTALAEIAAVSILHSQKHVLLISEDPVQNRASMGLW
jgi:hypothetical protein